VARHPGLPSYVFENLDRLEAKLDRLFNRVQTQRDQLPARIDNAGSIDLIHEATSDQITPVIRRLEDSLVRAGMLMIKLAQKYYTEPRLLKITGSNGSVRTRKFLNADLQGGFSFHAEAGSGLPRTRAGKQSRIEFMLQNQLIDQRAALKYLDTADMTGLMAKMQAAEEQAYRTIEKLKKGEPLNPVALAQAQAQAQQVMSMLQAGQPVDLDGDGMPDDPQQVVGSCSRCCSQASISPLPHEDPQIHLDVLTTFMNSTEFEGLDPQLESSFVDRYTAMLQMMQRSRRHRSLHSTRLRSRRSRSSSRQRRAPRSQARSCARRAYRSATRRSQSLRSRPGSATASTRRTPAMRGTTRSPSWSRCSRCSSRRRRTRSSWRRRPTRSISPARRRTPQPQTRRTCNVDARAEELHQQKMRHAEEMHQARLRQAKAEGAELRVAARTTYTETDKSRVYVVLAANDGNVKRTARETGVPENTVRRWKKEFEESPPSTELVEAAVGDFVGDADRVRHKALLKIEQLIDGDKVKVGELNNTVGILTDKIDRARGLDVKRVEHEHKLDPASVREALVGFMQDMQQMSKAREVEIVEAEIVEQPALTSGR
jgi:hypothetical protein